MNTTLISSPENKLYKQFISLLSSKGIKKHSQCIVSGTKIVDELKSSQPLNIVYHKPLGSELSEVILDPILFKNLDVFGTNAPLLIMPTANILDWNPSSPVSGLELFTASQDPGNLGAIIRSAAAFNVNKIILLEEACHPFHPKVTKSSSGSNFKINLQKGPSINQLPVGELYSLDLQGTPIKTLKAPKNLRLLIGEEGQGVPSQLNTQKITIPTSEQVESLNAATAAAIALFQLSNI